MQRATSDNDSSKPKLSPQELVDKLRKALQRDGDFPASAKIVSELRQLVADPKTTANQITEVILREPSLGTRVLHLVNSSFYRRAKPIMTVSQAVVQIGMKPLSELCAGLVLLQRFVPAARRDGVFANCLRKTIVTSLLSSSITSEIGRTTKGNTNEFGYLAGSFAELGVLLLAFYFPQIYESAWKRSQEKQVDLADAIRDITGLTPLQLSIEVLDALNMPPFYKQVLLASDQRGGQVAPTGGLPSEQQEIGRIGKALFAASTISQAVASNKGKQELEKVLSTLPKATGLNLEQIGSLVGNLPTAFKEHCSSIELALPALPEYVSSFSPSEGDAERSGDFQEDQFSNFVNEIRNAVENREPTASVITTVMETFAWSLKFDRVLLMLVISGKSKLMGRMMLGSVPNFDPKQLIRPLTAEAQPGAPEVKAFKESKPQYSDTPLLQDGKASVYVPIGFGTRAIGVIYADRTSNDRPELTSREQSAVNVLAELLDRSIGLSA